MYPVASRADVSAVRKPVSSFEVERFRKNVLDNRRHALCAALGGDNRCPRVTGMKGAIKQEVSAGNIGRRDTTRCAPPAAVAYTALRPFIRHRYWYHAVYTTVTMRRLARPTPGTPVIWTFPPLVPRGGPFPNDHRSARLLRNACGRAAAAGRSLAGNQGRGLLATLQSLKDSRQRESRWAAAWPPADFDPTKIGIPGLGRRARGRDLMGATARGCV